MDFKILNHITTLTSFLFTIGIQSYFSNPFLNIYRNGGGSEYSISLCTFIISLRVSGSDELFISRFRIETNLEVLRVHMKISHFS